MPGERRARNVRVETFEEGDLDAVVALSLRAWEPFFTSLPELVGDELAEHLHPDWRAEQTGVVTDGCTTAGHRVAVARVDDDDHERGLVVGFAVVILDAEPGTGELHLIAVDPAHQGRGVGAQLNAWALDVMRAAGMRVAHVGTGGDRTHAPARRSYERAGYRAIPTVHYFQLLDDDRRTDGDDVS